MFVNRSPCGGVSSPSGAGTSACACSKSANGPSNSANATQMKLVIVFMCLFPFISVLRIFRPKGYKNSRNNLVRCVNEPVVHGLPLDFDQATPPCAPKPRSNAEYIKTRAALSPNPKPKLKHKVRTLKKSAFSASSVQGIATPSRAVTLRVPDCLSQNCAHVDEIRPRKDHRAWI